MPERASRATAAALLAPVLEFRDEFFHVLLDVGMVLVGGDDAVRLDADAVFVVRISWNRMPRGASTASRPGPRAAHDRDFLLLKPFVKKPSA